MNANIGPINTVVPKYKIPIVQFDSSNNLANSKLKVLIVVNAPRTPVPSKISNSSEIHPVPCKPPAMIPRSKEPVRLIAKVDQCESTDNVVVVR